MSAPHTVAAAPLSLQTAVASLLGDDPQPLEASRSPQQDDYDAAARDAAGFAVRYTEAWQPQWYFNLCSLSPDGEPRLSGRSWQASEVAAKREEIAAWIAAGNRRGRNVYFTVNALSHRVDGKPKSADIAAYVALNIDADPLPEEHGGYAPAREALWAAVEAWGAGGVPAPSFVVDSGNGAALFFVLPEPEHDLARGRTAGGALQAQARTLMPGVKIDPTANADRLMRLPCTRNWPSRGKQERGYPSGDDAPWASLRVPFTGATLAPDAFAALGARQELRDRPAPAEVPQERHRAPSAKRFEALVDDMPNPEGMDHEGWVLNLRMMRAAACGVVDDCGESAARSWSERWPGVHKEAEFVRTWHSVKGPSLYGWRELADTARGLGSNIATHESALADFADMPLSLAAAQRGEAFGRLRVLTVADAIAAPPRRYLLKGLIAPGELSLWWGQPKCGKSFLLLRLAYGMALGRGLWGRKVPRSCRVLYVAAEGEGGFAARLLALRAEMGDAGDGFRYVAQRVDVGPPRTDVSAIIAAALEMRADIIVLDTLARTFGAGDENTAQDMNAFVASTDRLREDTGAHVAVIHHGRKDGGDARGSSALSGAADLIVRITRDTTASAATVEAAKDDADGAALPFCLRQVEIGRDDDGEMRWTCIAEEAVAILRSGPRLSAGAERALSVLAELIAGECTAAPGADVARPQSVEDFRWRAECESRRISTAEKKESRDRAFRLWLGELRDAGAIGQRGSSVWLTSALGDLIPEEQRPTAAR